MTEGRVRVAGVPTLPDPVVEQRVMSQPPRDLWQRALDQLRLVVPVATFDTLFANSTGQASDDGALVVTVANPHARAWIEARLSRYVTDALRAADFSGPVVYQPLSPHLRSARGAARGPTRGLPGPGSTHSGLPEPGPDKLEPGDVALSFLNFDLYARGWLRTPSYYELFWQPLLGYLPFAFWRLMQALFWSNPPDSFTRRVRLDIQKSAAHLGVSRDLVRGKPAHGLGGALITLRDLGLASVERHAAGRATIYTGRFLRRLPLLAPAQAARLSQSQQQQHLDWLLAAGFDLRLWEALGQDHSTFVAADGRRTGGRQTEVPSEAIPFFDPPWDSEPLARIGFLRTPIYYDLFLQPLIGPVAYAIWRVCKCLNWTDGDQTYTRDTVTSVYALAAVLNCNRQKITGVKRRKEGTAYWQDGAFDRLRQERLALIREEGEGSQLAYRMLVVNEPPLLCPSQVTKFGNLLQDSHARWLKRAQLQLEEWQQLPMDSLLTLLAQEI